jgi:hypothetical protein
MLPLCQRKDNSKFNLVYEEDTTLETIGSTTVRVSSGSVLVRTKRNIEIDLAKRC